MADKSPVNFEDFQRKCATATAPRIEDDKRSPVGLKNLDKDRLRCFLLQQKQEGIGGSRAVLDMENWYDCRVQYPPNPNAIIGQALIDLGFVKTPEQQARAGSMFDQIAADLEDSDNASDAGPLIGLLRMVASLPREGTLDRAQFDTYREKAITVALPMAAKYLKKAVPGAKEAVDDGLTIVKNLVDMAVATADYIVEYKAVREEAAARLYSVNRHDYIGKAFQQQYGLPEGSQASASTIAAWCRFGNERVAKTGNPNAYLFAPDGTDGEALAAKAAYEAAMLTAGRMAKELEKRFGLNWKKFFGISGMIGAWVLAYKRDDVHPTAFDYQNADAVRGYPGFGSNSILRYIGAAAMENEDAYELFQGDIETPVKTERKVALWWDKKNFGMVLDAAPGEKPFVSRVWWPSFGLEAGGDTPAARKGALLQKATAFMWAAYMEGNKKTLIKQEEWFGKKTRMKLEKSPKLTDGYAADVWAVWRFWEFYVQSAMPAFGKRKKWEFMRDKVFAPNVDRYFDALDSGKQAAVLNKMSWAERVVYALEGRVTDEPRVSKRPPAPCPTGGTDCLPCDVIKDRLPIGAKAIDIPMFIEHTGHNARQSPEFKAWAKNLADNGYPGYYIDCLARDVTFKSKATDKVTKGESASKTDAAGARAANAAKGASYTPSLYDGLRGVQSGLTAPRVMKLDAPTQLLTPAIPFDDLDGIIRPLSVEWVRGK